MLQFVGNYSLRLGERVECYYNSKKKAISVRSIDIRNENYLKIVAYTEYLHLENTVFSYCASNHRKIYRGTYCGCLPVMPSSEHIVQHTEDGFFTTSGIEVIGSKYAICYLNMLLAEQVKIKGAENNESIYEKWVI